MKRLLSSLFLFAGLALTSLGASADYKRLDNPQPPEAAPGKVVVQQILWHRCIHCYHLEPAVDAWLKEKADYIEFERVPVVWDRAQLEQSSYYGLAKVMHAAGEIDAQAVELINASLFELNFVEKKPFDAPNVFPLFQAYGIGTPEKFIERLNSEAVDAQRKRSYDLTRAYRVSGVPSFVVNGTYLVDLDGLGEDRSPEKLFATINQLAKQELERSKAK